MVSVFICPERKLAIVLAGPVIIKVFSFWTREVTIVLAISVRVSKRIITTIHTSTIPIQIPSISARIIAEISVPLMPVFLRESTIVHASSIKVKSLVFVTFIAAKVFIS